MKSSKKILSLLLTLAVLVLAVTMLFSCKKTATVNFESDGGTNVASVTVNVGTAISAPQNPTRSGYHFAGWTTEDGVLWDFATPITGDTLLIASWVKDDSLNKATVSFDLKGGDKTNFTTSVEVQKGSVLAKPENPVKVGYEFAGWFYLGEEYKFENRVVADDITLVAHWKLLTYSISYDLQGGKLGSSVSEYTTEADAIIPNPEKVGYEFIGWTYEGASAPKTSLVIAKGSAGDYALTANWRLVEYGISYELSGADAIELPVKYNIETESFTLPALTKANYDFLGWQLGGEGAPVLDFSVAKGSSGNISLTAVFAPTQYEIKYNLGEGGVNSPENPLYTTLVSDEYTIKAPTRPGYKFVGWLVGASTEPVSELTIEAGNTASLELSAVWEKDSYTATYYDFNGKLHEGEALIESFTVDILPIKLPNLYFNNKCFISWYTDEDFTNPITEITECKDIVLYAKFVEISDGLEFTFNGAGYDVTGYTGTADVVAIPEIYKQLPVTSIANSAFAGAGVVDVYLPESIALIAEKAFFSAENLKNVYIPENAKLTEIGKLAFAGCAIESFKAPAALEIIGEGAFLGCDGLNLINLEDTAVSVISSAAFEGTSLVNVSLPASISIIGDGAFYAASSLKSVVFASGAEISAIGNGVFKNCMSLESIVIPAGVESVGEGAFENCQSLACIGFEENSLLSYVGKSAFRNCDALVSVSFPASLNVIDEYAFYSNDSLSALAFVKDGELESIGKNAFYGSAIVSLELPDNLSVISEGAFFASSALESVSFNENLSIIEKSAFASCVSLKAISLASSTVAMESSFEACSAVESLTVNKYDAREIFGGALPAGIKNITLLNDAQIAEGVFEGLEYLESLTVPFVGLANLGATITVDGVEIIATEDNVKTFVALFGGEAPMSLKTVTVTGGAYVAPASFLDCKYIQSITLPISTVSIGNGAFLGCSALSYLELPLAMSGDDEIDYVTVNYTVEVEINGELVSETLTKEVSTKTLAYVFEDAIPSSLRSVKLSAYGNANDGVLSEGVFVGSSVREVVLVGFGGISNDAFQGVSSLTSLDISASDITEIGDRAFLKTSKLESFTVPAKLSYIGYNAFAESGVREVSFETGSVISDIRDGAFMNCLSLENITLPDTVKVLSGGIFSGCISLSEIAISDEIEVIGRNAFQGCSALTGVSFGADSKLTSIDAYAFKNSGIESFTLPLSVESVAVGVFEDCVSLKEFNFTLPKRGELAPEGFVISEYAFKNTSLESISIPDYVIAIEAYAFEGVESLAAVSFGEESALVSIGTRAFADCANLRSIAIPDGVSVITEECFKNCSTLASVSFGDGSLLSEISSGAFESCLFLESFTVPKSVVAIGDSAFANCFTLREVNVSLAADAALVSLGASAFKNCDALVSIALPASLSSLGEFVFYNCDALEAITFEDGSLLTEIPANAFLNCVALKSFAVPVAINSIGASAFQGCSALESVIFAVDSKLASIGDSAFNGCASLVSFTAPAALEYIGEEAFRNCRELASIEITTKVSVANFAFRESLKLVIKVTYFELGGDVEWLSSGKLASYWNTEGSVVEFILAANQ